MNGQKKREYLVENVLSLMLKVDMKYIAFRIADFDINYNREV